MGKASGSEAEELSLTEAIGHLLEECRTVLPGIQALFGFQLIAVFNTGFTQVLDEFGRHLHLLAIVFIVVSIALIMTPAAYHRQTGPERVTRAFLDLSSNLLLAGMLPLSAGICLDFYVVAHAISNSRFVILLSIALFMFLVFLWFILPHVKNKKSSYLMSGNLCSVKHYGTHEIAVTFYRISATSLVSCKQYRH